MKRESDQQHATPPSAEGKHGEMLSMPDGLHRETQRLVLGFAAALAEKLRAAEVKYGYSDFWSESDWREECLERLHEHLAKGDPRDVANYCAFMWFHGWRTEAAPVAQSESAPIIAGLYPTCAELARRDIELSEAAHDLLIACEMEQHNEDIFKGKWKKGSKGWSGDFVAKIKADAMARVKALTDPRKPATQLPEEQ